MKWAGSKGQEPGSTLVPVVWYETVHQWEELHSEPLRSLHFHKIVTLTKFRLDSRGIRLPVPYAWFTFGTTAADLPHVIQFYPDARAEETNVSWRGETPELYSGDKSADAIRATIRELIHAYPPTLGERAVDEVYSHAPFEFQNRFRRVRIAFGVTGAGSEEQDSINVAGGLWSLVLDAFDAFPFDRFAQLSELVYPVREVVKLTISANLEQNRKLATEVLEGFWSTFAAYLRLDPEGHSNVSPTTVQRWRGVAEVRREVFARNLGDIVVELGDQDPHLVDDATLGPLAEKRRGEQTVEERLVEDGLDAVAGASLGQMRRESAG